MPLYISETIFPRLLSRLKLAGRADMPLAILQEVVAPVISLDHMLLDPVYNELATADVSAAIKILATVPVGEQWHLKGLSRGAMVSTTARVVIRNLAGAEFPLHVGQAAAVNTQGLDLWLRPGTVIKLEQGNVADTAITGAFYYEREELNK